MSTLYFKVFKRSLNTPEKIPFSFPIKKKKKLMLSPLRTDVPVISCSKGVLTERYFSHVMRKIYFNAF